MLTPRLPRLTASRHGFLARSTALSWPWNKDRIRAAPGTMPPTFTDLALGLVDRTKPVIQVWWKDPLQREDHAGGTASPVVPPQAGTQGATTHSAAEPEALDPRFREDDREALVSAQNPLQPEHPQQFPLRPPGDHASGGEGRGEVGKLQPAEPHISTAATPAQNPLQRERTGPLRNGNPRGNPNLAPRCGARTRRTGCPCRAPAMRNGRCRLHGGKSTGPRTEEGRARIRAARTRHGLYSAESRAFQRDINSLLRSNRELLALARQPGPGNAMFDAAALSHLLPPDFGKHLMQRETTTRPIDALRRPCAGRGPEAMPRQNEYQLPPSGPAAMGPRLREQDDCDLARSPAPVSGCPPVMREPAPATSSSARPPILLARPIAHAT